MRIFDKAELFAVVHDYFKVYLPTQKRCSPNTVRSYAQSLESLLDFVKEKRSVALCDVTFEMIDFAMLAAFMQELEATGCSIPTRNLRLAAIRSFYKYAAAMHPTITAFQNEVLKVPAKPQGKAMYVKYLRENEVKAILEQPSVEKVTGLRDKAILVFLYDSAARVQELVDVKICDLRLGEISTVTLHGKGSKVRTVPIMKKTTDLLRKYIDAFHPEATQYSEDYLFYTKRRVGNFRMSEDNIRKIILRYANRAKAVCNSLPDNIHPHMFRHSRAMHLYQNGMDLILISQWLGHAQLETTLIYAYADTEMKRDAIEKATKSDNILRKKDSLKRYKITDEEMLKKLCGLN
ncbi:MAG: site-specific integrase [Firmicutes bacterium]|nr:site-specific integrase [Bacillota bacterium]